MTDNITAKIQEIMDKEISPALAMDGGGIALVEYKDGVVYVQLKGACKGCPGATMTIKMGVEARLRERIPEIKSVVSV